MLELLGLCAASLSILGSQVAMTRVLSLKYAANQTFLVVSFAVLGLAIGAAAAHWLGQRGKSLRALPALGMLLFAVALCLLTASFYLNLASIQQIGLVPLPFIGVGLCISAIFAQRSAGAGYYYAVDLCGAALGAFGAAPLLDVLSAPTALLFFAASAAVSAALFMPSPRAIARAGAVIAAAGAGAAVVSSGFPFEAGHRVPIYPDAIKDMLVVLAQNPEAVLEESRWSAFGRTDVVDDGTGARRKVIFVDGAAGSSMMARGFMENEAARDAFRDSFGPALVLSMLEPAQKRSALSIGSGGGRDVLACRVGGVENITAVELNPDIVDIVRDHAAFSGNVYDGSDVETFVEEGRHFLRASERMWDVILLSIPVTKRGESYGGFALSESYIFTRESIGEYLDHVDDDGMILIVCHSQQEVGRLINTYLETMRTRGVEPPEAMMRAGVFGELLITLVITREPQSELFWRRLEITTRRLNLARPDDRFYFMPGETRQPALMSPALAAISSGAAVKVTMPRVSSSTFEPDMSPVSDDRPFFYFFTQSLPPLVTLVLAVSGGVLMLMVLRGVAGGGPPGAGPSVAERLFWHLAVAGLGIAFMMVEVPLIQRFIFWFGKPTQALGLLLGMLLLATGAGSLLAGLLVRGRLARTWPPVAVLGVFLLLGFEPAQQAVFAAAEGGFSDSLLRSAAIVVPAGLLMGVPFPMLLTAAGRRAGVSVAWLWGINGVGSVAGSALAIAIAMLVGYSWALMAAGGAYCLVAAAILLISRNTPESFPESPAPAD